MNAVRKTKRAINEALLKFANSQGMARRFHNEDIGDDIDANHCFADFLCCVAQAKSQRLNEQRAGRDRLEKAYKTYQPDRQKTALHESQGAVRGGYLVPQEMQYTLMDDVWELAVIRPRAMVQPMTTLTLDLPLVDMTTAPTSSGIAPWFGSVNMIWTEESTTFTESEPKWRLVQLRASLLGGYAIASNTLLLDGGNGLEAYLRHLFAGSIAWYEDYAFLRGNGVGKPLGLLNAGATIAVNRTASNTFILNDASNLYNNLMTRSNSAGIWITNQNVTIVMLQDQLGNSSWISNMAGPVQLFGMPVYVTEKLPNSGSFGDVLLVDPGMYIIGDRQQIEVDVSQEVGTQFLNNQSAWRISERVDGQPWVNAPITLQNTTTTVSPYVALN